MQVALDERVTQKVFGSIVNLHQSNVSDLVSRKVIAADGTLGEWIADYVAHLRMQAAGRGGEGVFDLVQERARLAAAQADHKEMVVAQLNRELAPVHVIEQVIAKTLSQVVTILESIPVEIERSLPALGEDGLDIVRNAIAKIRNEATASEIDWNSIDGLEADSEDAEERAPQA